MTEMDAFTHGREWMTGLGPYSDLDCIEAAERYGYMFGSIECTRFIDGALSIDLEI